MSNTNPTSSIKPLHQKVPPPIKFVPAALIWAAVATAILIGFVLLLGPRTSGPSNTDSSGQFLVFQGFLWLLVFGLLFIARWAWLSRIVADRLFRVCGFTATFFGLVILALFFVSLIVNIYAWFQVMPVLIEQENQRLVRIRDGADEYTALKLSSIRKEMKAKIEQAADEQEKLAIQKHYEDDIIPTLLQQIELRAEERKQSAASAIRNDTSAGALLWHFLSTGPSNQPQNTGIFTAILGSLWIALITLLFAVPVGVGAALYLEEYRSKSWIGNLIQVNINNLAGVPSVVYGILGAFVFVELIFKPIEHINPQNAARNVLGGGLTLGLLTLPVVIVAAQEAIRAVPKSIREGAYALGATQWQVIWHQVLPMARPGILTGTILSISRAIGEAAPLLLFGALLFVSQEPGLFRRFTVLPMQIYGWASRPAQRLNEVSIPVWQYNAALASMVLLLLLLVLNAVAIFLRYRAQRDMRY